MRSYYIFPIVIFLLLILSGCAAEAGAELFGPEINVTPAEAPIGIPGVTPVPVAEVSAAEETDVVAEQEAEVVLDPTETPTPERTPVRIKVPSTPLVQPTEPPVATAPVEEPATATSAPAEPTLEESTATATPVPATNTPTAEPTTPVPPTPTEYVVTATPTTTAETVVQEVEVVTPVALDRPAPPTSFDNTLNILIVGSDQRGAGGYWRSDVIMVAAVDFASGQVGVLSIPRDLWVPIPTVGENRINTATFWGGLNNYPNGGDVGLLKDTISKNFGIRIDHYLKFSFDSFKDIVDALGGVDVEIDCAITGNFPREPGSKVKVRQTLQPGVYHMEGLFALQYVRERKATSDVDRMRRQQRMIIAIRNRARDVNIVPRLPALYDAMKGTIQTDLGLTDLIALTRLGLQIDPDDAHGYSIGFKDTQSYITPEGASVLLPRWDVINEKLQRVFEQPSILKRPAKSGGC